ncbi:MAG: NUDIX domain-containing protein [Nitriliruptoraceae bacterium]|nr:NUDIX domain-containing protein [Nitriliruptoraceae bacterium]
MGPEHVRQRVSVRWLVDDPTRGEVPSDVVGRLLAMDEQMLLIVDRAGRLHVVDAGAVLASRVVPAHPRLPAEPDVGTEQAPLERDAARVVLFDADDRVLLVAHAASDDRRVWTTPGGGLEQGEDHATAARRELVEEIGIDLAPGPQVFSRQVRFTFRGVWLDQRERWFLTRLDTGHTDLDAAPLDDTGALAARWWTVQELADTDEVIAPRDLHVHLARLLDEGPPDAPVALGR